MTQLRTDKKPFYIWLVVALANIGVYLSLLIIDVNDEVHGSGAPVLESLLAPITLPFLAFLLVSVFAVWHSESNFAWLRRIGYSNSILSLIVASAISAAYGRICDGWLCGVVGIITVGALWCALITFATFHAIGSFFRKWNIKVVIAVIWIELILLFCAALFLGNFLRQDFRLTSLQKKTETPETFARFCDTLPPGRRSRCWFSAIETHPNVDVCSWAKEAGSEESCLDALGIIYRENKEKGCEDQDSQLSYSKKDDAEENTQLAVCWKDKAKIYPKLDICQWTYEWNQEKCVRVIGRR